MNSLFPRKLIRKNLESGPRGAAGPSFAASVHFKDIRRRFGGVSALNGVSLEVKPGETICLLGESGCGKTTLLRIAAGIETADGGVLKINDKEMCGPQTHVPPEKRRIGLVFQDYALFPHLTILKNIMFGLTALRRKDAATVARQALKRVRLLDYEDAYPHMLSGGQQQRVALARAIAPRPEVLLLDEPFSGLDAVLRATVREETIAVLRETQATSIIVTHDPEEAFYLGDRVALMNDGKIEQVGTPEDLYLRPRNSFVAGFLGGLNHFTSVVEAGSVRTPIGTFAAPGFGKGAKVDVFVRVGGVDVNDVVEGDGCVHGRVLSERFVGENRLISVLVDGGEAPLSLKIPTRQVLKSDHVSFVVDPASVLIFTKSIN